MFKNAIIITNRHLAAHHYPEQIRRALQLGAFSLILREKDLSPEKYRQLALTVAPLCRQYDTSLYIHSFIELARQIPDAGIHLTMHDLRLNAAKLSDFTKISVSCHSIEEIQEAGQLGATQIILGNIFETDCKAGLKGKGLSFLEEACRQVSLPVYAIGGITPERLPELTQHGAAGGCMMSWFMRC